MSEKLPARQDDWELDIAEPVFKEPFLYDMVQLANKLRLQNLTREEMLTKVIYDKVQRNAMPTRQAPLQRASKILRGYLSIGRKLAPSRVEVHP